MRKTKFLVVCLLIMSMLLSVCSAVFAAEKADSTALVTVETSKADFTGQVTDKASANVSGGVLANAITGYSSLKVTSLGNSTVQTNWTVTSNDLITRVELWVDYDGGSNGMIPFFYNTFPWYSQSNQSTRGLYPGGYHTVRLHGRIYTISGYAEVENSVSIYVSP